MWPHIHALNLFKVLLNMCTATFPASNLDILLLLLTACNQLVACSVLHSSQHFRRSCQPIHVSWQQMFIWKRISTSTQHVTIAASRLDLRQNNLLTCYTAMLSSSMISWASSGKLSSQLEILSTGQASCQACSTCWTDGPRGKFLCFRIIQQNFITAKNAC